MPELLFFFDIEPSLSLKRIKSRNVTEIYEKQDFLEKTRIEYHRVIKFFENSKEAKEMKIVWIDASESEKKVAENIWSVLKNIPILN